MNITKLISALRTDPNSLLNTDFPREIQDRATQEKLDLLIDPREIDLNRLRTQVVKHCAQHPNPFALSCAEQIALWMCDRQCDSGSTQGFLLLEWLSEREDATPSVLYNLSIKIQTGVGCQPDAHKAFELLQRAHAAESEDSYLLGMILQAIGNSYFDGCGIDQGNVPRSGVSY